MEKKTWKRIRSGLYVWEHYEIEREVKDDGKVIWICRCNGTCFDAGDTLAEAKTYCY